MIGDTANHTLAQAAAIAIAQDENIKTLLSAIADYSADQRVTFFMGMSGALAPKVNREIWQAAVRAGEVTVQAIAAQQQKARR